MKISIKLKSLFILLITAFTFNSCVKKEYDDLETANVDPDLTPTHTIRELQALAIGPAIQITDDIIIEGVIVGDDSSGNIYKQIILQQDSNGIAIDVDQSNYYVLFKVGRKLFIKCKGLWLANDNGNFELGTAPDGTNPVGRILAANISQYIYKGMWGQYIAPRVYHIDDVIPTNTLVQFDGVEFLEHNVVWAAAGSQNRTIVECGGASLTVYTSAYSTFHYLPIPSGNGSMVGIYTLYNGAGEIQVRDERDAKMTGPTCSAYIASLPTVRLDSLRMHDPGTGTYTIPDSGKITVTVISDYTTNMTNSKNCYVQDNTGGMEIRFSGSFSFTGHTFARGTQLQIDVTNRQLSNYNGVLQITIPIQYAIPGAIAQVTPLTTTIANINANYDALEGVLVKLDNVTITGTGTYQGASGVNTITDGSNTIELYTSAGATFVNDHYPTGTVSVTGILTEYVTSGGVSTKEILIRNTSDVQ
jgi:hypothetical protein